MQASMNEFVQFLEGRDDGVHQSTENSELMEPRSPSSRGDSRTISKQLDDSNKLPPPSYIEELVFGILGISEAEQNTTAPSLSIPREVAPTGPPSEPKTFAIDGSNESYSGNWDESLLENDYDFPCLSSYSHEVVITTETQSSGTADKEIADRLVANTNDYSLEVLAQEKLDAQRFQVDEALHMTTAPNLMCKSVIDTLQEDSTFFEDMGFDMRNSAELKDCKGYYESSTSEINAGGSPEDVSPACSNLHIVPISDGVMEVTSSPPEEFAVSLSRDGVVEMEQVSSPDVAKVPISTGHPMTPPTCQEASTSQRPVLDLSACCGPYGAVVKNQIVLACSGDAILSENESLDSQDYGMPKLVRADDLPPPVADQIYDGPPELDPVELPSANSAKKGIKTTTSTLASAAGEDLLKSSKKTSLGVLPETIQEAQEELNDSLGKIVPSFTPDISNQIPAYMNEIYDVRNISLESTCSPTITNTTTPPLPPGSLPLLPVTEEPKVYKTFKKVSPSKKTKSPDVKSKDSSGVDKGFVRDLLRSVNGGPSSLSGPNCVVEFTNKAPVESLIHKDFVVGVSHIDEKHFDSSGNDTVIGHSLFSSSPSVSTNNLLTASSHPKSTPSIVGESSLKVNLKSLPDLPTLLEIKIGEQDLTKVRSNLSINDMNAVIPSLHNRVSRSEPISSTSEKTVTEQSNGISQVVEKGDITCSSAFTSPTSLKNTIITDVAEDVVNEVRKCPQLGEDIKTKKSAQIKMLEKPVASTSVKVSLPISSLDLLSVKPISEPAKRVDVSCKENTNVILGVSTPTMAQRKQYANSSIEHDSKSLLVEETNNNEKNRQNVMKKRSLIVPKEQLRLKSMEGEMSRDGVKIDLITMPGNVTISPVSSSSSIIVPPVSDKSYANDDNIGISLNAKLIKGLLDEMNLTRRPVDLYKIHPDTENRSSTVVNDLDTPKKSCDVPHNFSNIPSRTDKSSNNTNNFPSKIIATSISHGKIENTLKIDEQADGLIEHPVIDVINSLISSSKKPDLFEEQPSFPIDEKQNTPRSERVNVEERTPPVIKKLDAKSRNPINNDKVKLPLDLVPIKQNSCTDVGKSKSSASQSPGAVSISVPPKNTIEKKPVPAIVATKTMTRPVLEKRKPMTQVADEYPISLKSGVCDEQSTKEALPDDLDNLKKSSPLENNVKQKPPIVVKRRRTRSSLDLLEKPITLQDGTKEQQCKALEITRMQTNVPSDSLGKSRANDVIEKSIVLENVIEKQKARLLKDIVAKLKESSLTNVSKIPDTTAEIVQKQKVTSSQSAVDKSQTTQAENMVDKTKQKHELEVVGETSPHHSVTIASSERVLSGSTTESSRIQMDEKTPASHQVGRQKTTSTRGEVDQLKTATSNAQFENRKITTLQNVAERTKESSQDVVKKDTTRNSLQGVEKKERAVNEEVCEKKPLVDESLSVSSIIMADGTKTTPVQGVAKQCKRQSQNIVEKGVKATEDVEQMVGVVERKSAVNQVPAVSVKVVVDRTLASTQLVVAEKPEEKVNITTAKESPETLKEVLEKKKGTYSKEVVVNRNLAETPKTVSSSTEVGVTKTSSEQEKLKASVIGTVKETIKTSCAVVEKKKSVLSKEEVSERNSVTDKPKTDPPTTKVDVSKMSSDQFMALDRSEDDVQAIKSTQELSEKKGVLQSKEVHVERKPTNRKLKTASITVAADKINVTPTQNTEGKLNDKLLNKVGKGNTKTPHEVSEKKKSSAASSKDKVVEIPSTEKSKPSSNTSVVEKNKMVKPKLVKVTTATSHNLGQKEKSSAHPKEIVAERPSKGKSKPFSDSEEIHIASPLDVDKESEPKFQKDNAATNQSVAEKYEINSLTEEAVVERTPKGRSNPSSNTAVVGKIKVASPLDVGEKSKPLLQMENAISSHNVAEEERSSAQPKEIDAERPSKSKSKPSSPVVATEKMNVVTQVVIEKHRGKFKNLIEKENSEILLGAKPKKVVAEREETVSLKVVDTSITRHTSPNLVPLKVVLDSTNTTSPLDVKDKHNEKRNKTAPEMLEIQKRFQHDKVAKKTEAVCGMSSHSETETYENNKLSKEVVLVHPSKGKLKPFSNIVVPEKNNIATSQDVEDKSKPTLKKENATASQKLLQNEKSTAHPKEVVPERPSKSKSKPSSNTAVAENNRIAAPLGANEKSKTKLQKEKANTSQDVSEKETNSSQAKELMPERPSKDISKSSATTVVGEKNKIVIPEDVDDKSKPKLQKENATTAQDVVDKEKSSLQTSKLELLSKGKSKPSSPVVATEKINFGTQVVSEKRRAKLKNSVMKERNSQILTSDERTKAVVISEREESVSLDVIDIAETSINRQTSTNLVPLKVALDSMNTTSPQEVKDKHKEKLSNLVDMESTKTIPEILEVQKSIQHDKVVKKTEAVSLKAVIVNTNSAVRAVPVSQRDEMKASKEELKGKTETSNNSQVAEAKEKKLVVTPKPSPTREVAKTHNSDRKAMDQRQKSSKTEIPFQEYKPAPNQSVVDEQSIEPKGENKKNIVCLKKSKSSDLLVGRVKSRTAKMVHTARQLSLESIVTKKNSSFEKTKKPALGHWRIVKQDKETTGVDSHIVSESIIDYGSGGKSKTRLRKKSDTSLDGKSENNFGHNTGKLISGICESSDKVQTKEVKPSAIVNSSFDATNEETKIRRRTRSETSNDRKLKDVEKMSSNNSLPKQGVTLDRNTLKQTKEMSSQKSISSSTVDSPQKLVESSINTSVNQSKTPSTVDLKPVAQTATSENVIEDNTIRSRTRSETSTDRKEHAIMNSLDRNLKETSGLNDPVPGAMTKSAHYDNEKTVGKEINNSSVEPPSLAAESDPLQEETITRLQTRSETVNEKKFEGQFSQSNSSDKKAGHNEFLAKRVASVDKNLLKPAKDDISNVDVKSTTRMSRSDAVPESSNQHRLRTRSETSSEKKLKKDDTNSRSKNKPQNITKTIPKSVDVDKIPADDSMKVFDFIEDDAPSNIDQFRNLIGKSVKIQRMSLPTSEPLELSIVGKEDTNKLNDPSRKSRSETTKVGNGKKSRKSSPKKISLLPTNRDGIVIEKINRRNSSSDKKSYKSPERISSEVGKEDGPLSNSSDDHSGSKEGTATRSRSRDLTSEESTASPNRVLRSKVKQPITNPAANSVTNRAVDVDVNVPPLDAIVDQKAKGTCKIVHKSETGCGKYDSTTGDSILCKHQSGLTKNNVEKQGIEYVDSYSNKRKTRSCVKPTDKIVDNSTEESCPSPNDSIPLPIAKLRSSGSKKLNVPNTLMNEGSSDESNVVCKLTDKGNDTELRQEFLEEVGSLTDSVSLKSEKVGDDLKIIIKRVKIKKPVQGVKADNSNPCDSDVVKKFVRETTVDVMSKEKLKSLKTVISDVGNEVLPNQSTILSPQDNTVCNAEAVSLKSPPMGSVVTPETDNIQAVNDMSQHREPEGAKSSTRTAQLRSLALSEGFIRNGREQVTFQRDKDRVEKKRLTREDKQRNMSPTLENFTSIPPVTPSLNSPSTMEIVNQRSSDVSSRNSSPSKISILESNKQIECSLITDGSTSENEDCSRRRVTRSSLASASVSLPKSFKKRDLGDIRSKSRRCSVGAPRDIKQNNDTSELLVLQDNNVLKNAHKQTGKRTHNQFDNTLGSSDGEAPVKSKLRKIEKNLKLHSGDMGLQADNSKIMASIRTNRLNKVNKKVLPHERVVLKTKSDLELKNDEATNKKQELKDRITDVSLLKEKGKKDIDANLMNSLRVKDAVPVSKIDVPLKAASSVILSSSFTPDDNLMSPKTEQKLVKSSSSRRKSKLFPPTKRVPSVSVGLVQNGRKTSVEEVCLASESLDKILREEDIKEVPSGFVVLAQSPGKSPDSTTQSRADIVISKLTQEPITVNTEKMSEDSQGVTSTTEIENMLIVNPTQLALMHETKALELGIGKKEDEGVSSTTVDSKICSIPYSDTKLVVNKKKNLVKTTATIRQSIDEPPAVRGEQTKEESIVKTLPSKPIPESVSKQLKNLDLEVLSVSVKEQAASVSGVCETSDGSPEYDVRHPRRKIWRLKTDPIKPDVNSVKVQYSSHDKEPSNVRSLSDEELKPRDKPLKKRHVWGIQLDNKVVNVEPSDEGPRNDDKTQEKAGSNQPPASSVDHPRVGNKIVNVEHSDGGPRIESKKTLVMSPTSSVDLLTHSIFNILQKEEGGKAGGGGGRCLSREFPTSSRIKKSVKSKKPSKKVRTTSSRKSVSATGGGCLSRRGLRKSSWSMPSFHQKNGKMKLRKRMKRTKRVKTPKKEMVVVEHSRASCGQPPFLVDETLKSSNKSTESQESMSSNIKYIVPPQPNKVQNDLLKPSPSKNPSSLLSNDNLPPVTAQHSAPVVPNYKELTVDPCEDDEASPQYSPLRPQEQDSVSPELPVQTLSNFSGSFKSVTPKWSNHCTSGTVIVRSPSSNGGSFKVLPQRTPVPRPITERSRSFSSLRQTSKPRARRESHPALPPAVQSPIPVDLSFSRKNSPSHGSTSHLGVNPKGLMISSNFGKLDLKGQNPTFYPPYAGDIVTFDLVKNQVVLLKPTSASHINRPVDTIPPMTKQLNVPTPSYSTDKFNVPTPSYSTEQLNVPTNSFCTEQLNVPTPSYSTGQLNVPTPCYSTEQLNVPTPSYSTERLNVPAPSSGIPLHPVSIPNIEVRTALNESCPPSSDNKEKIDGLIPTAKSSLNDLSQFVFPLDGFHAMKKNASSRSPNANQQKKTDHNPLIYTHGTLGTHFMLSSNTSCTSTSATNLAPSNRRNKSTRPTTVKPDVSSHSSSKITFTNLKSHVDSGRSTHVKANEIIDQIPLFNQSEANGLPFYPEDCYKLSRLSNINSLVHPSLPNRLEILSVASEQSYKNDRVRNDQSLMGRNREALQKVVREFNEGMNSMKDSTAVPSANEFKSDGTNQSGSGVFVERNISENRAAIFTPPDKIVRDVEIMINHPSTGSKDVKLYHSKTVLTEKVEEPLCQSSKSNEVCAIEVKVAQDSEPVFRSLPFSEQSMEKCNAIAGSVVNSEKPETLEEVTKSSVLNVLSVSKNVLSVSENCSGTLIVKEHDIECPDRNFSKKSTMDESPIETCASSDSVIDVVSLPITESKDYEAQVDLNCAHAEYIGGNKAAEKQTILATEMRSSAEIAGVDVEISSPVLQQSVSEKVETITEMDQSINNEPQTAVNTDLTSATDTPVERKDVEAIESEKPAVLLSEKSLIKLDKPGLDNISNYFKETDVHITDHTETEIDTKTKIIESTTIHSEQQHQTLQQLETNIQSKIQLPTENCEISLKSNDLVEVTKESVGTTIVLPPVAPENIDTCDHSVPFDEAKVGSVQFGGNGNSSYRKDDSIKPKSNEETDSMLIPVSIGSPSQTEEQVDKPTDQVVPEKSLVSTDHLPLSDGPCPNDDSRNPNPNEDIDITLMPFATESQLQKTGKNASSDIVCTSHILDDDQSGGLLSSSVHIPKSEDNLVDVSERSLGPAGENSVDLDGACGDLGKASSVGLDPITDLESSNPIEFSEQCDKVDIKLESLQPLDPSSKASEAPEGPITSLTPQNSPEVTELPSDSCNQDLITVGVVCDLEGSNNISSLNTSVSLPSDATASVCELSKLTNSSVHSSSYESSTLVNIPNSVSEECSNFSIGNNSNLNCADQIGEMERSNDRTNFEERSEGSNLGFYYSRKRRHTETSEDEDVESNKSFDSTCQIKRCRQGHVKVKIRPISPTTVDEIVSSGIKIKHSELQDIVKCWQEYCRTYETVSRRVITVGMAENEEATKLTGREVNDTAPRGPADLSSRFGNDFPRPSTSREFGNDLSRPFNIPSPLRSMRDRKGPKNVTAHLLEREREINRNLKRTTRVGGFFANGVKIHQRDCDVKQSRVESFASSRRISTIAHGLATVPSLRSTIHRSYSWIVEHLRERRKNEEYIESTNVQSCKDFINGVSKDALARCETTLSMATATHSRLSGSSAQSVTNRPPTHLETTTITVISSDSEDSNPGGTEHAMKDRDEMMMRKRVRRKDGTSVNLPCSCQSPSQNSNSHVCHTCRKEKSHAHGTFSPVRSFRTSLYTKEPERVVECATAVGGGEETVIVPDSNSFHLLKALMTLAGRRPPSSDTYEPPYSLSCDDPGPTSHTEVFSLPYEKELVSTRVTVTTPDPSSHDVSPHPLPEAARGSTTQCLQEKPSPEEAPCIFERNDTNLQQHSERGGESRSQGIQLLHATTPGTSTLHLGHLTSKVDLCSVVEPSRESDPISCDSPLSSACHLDDPQVPPEEEGDAPSTSTSREEANRLLGRVVEKLTPDLLVEIQRLLSGEEPPSKKRKE